MRYSLTLSDYNLYLLYENIWQKNVEIDVIYCFSAAKTMRYLLRMFIK